MKRKRDPQKDLAQLRKWREANREKHRAQVARYRARYPEKVRAAKLKWQNANLATVRPKQAAWARANAAQAKATTAAWRKENPDKAAAHCEKHRMLKLNAPGRGVTPEQWQEILDASLGLCAYCNERKTLEMDHIEPLSCGGAHDPDNVAAACRGCNASKSNTPLLVWLAKRALAA